ncbi:DUF4160 domain-containing protein [Adhaeribacter pallidiroseus]|uniref:DUF4160 domain-containing protein n=1 Tax=Adhaeribacter pallidiroseus TaxID=2072847 RepID=A0A369QM07_9BACT|nr:DUF4160 domain-containing protein [Adhaeribacter pallidiroseus]RDC65973.1 hypothetical protein AHMF7616_04604 [Adhaeribacter pallidiroseus]
MPTILKTYGLRFFFFSNEATDPAHVHVEKNNAYAKYYLSPVEHAFSFAFNANELSQIRNLVQQHQSVFLTKWNEFIGQ